MSSEGSSSSPEHGLRNSRISKENLYMVLALWMEDFPVEREEADEPYKRVGAVLVLPNDMSYAVDCSRNGVHGVARLLIAHQDILQDCKVFVSRKPCSLCTKLLVQSKVKRVFYLPVEPEYSDVGKTEFENEKSRVDELFKVSSIAQSVFVPKVGKDVIQNAEEKKKVTSENMKDIEEEQKKLMETYWKNGWVGTVRKKLPWPAFDEKMENRVKSDFHDVTTWMALIQIGSEKKNFFFKAEDEQTPTTSKSFVPKGNGLECRQALHFITLAKFLAERTDDPIKGVGAVIINKQKDVLGLGWNGFPTKALYGEFPRAAPDKGKRAAPDEEKGAAADKGKRAKPDEEKGAAADKEKGATPDKEKGAAPDKEKGATPDEEKGATPDEKKDKKDNIKYPYIIHAEQNALLMRNTKIIEDATIFVTKTPCDECTPLLEMQGIKTFVLGVEQMEEKEKHGISYRKFAKKVKDGDFTCFTMKKSAGESSGESLTNSSV